MQNYKNIILDLWKNKLFNDSLWAILGNVLGKGLSLLSGLFIAKLLGRDIFGEFSIIKGTVLSVSILSTFGLGYSTTKFIAENKNKNPVLVPSIIEKSRYFTIVIGFIFAFLLFLNTEYIATKLLNSPNLSDILKLVSIWLVLNAYTTTQIGILAGLGQFKGLALNNTITGILLFFLSISLTYFLNLLGALVSLIISQLINSILNEILIVKHQRINFIKSENYNRSFKISELIQYSTPITIQELVYAFSTWMSSVLIIQFSSYGQLGMYNAAMQISAMILYIPGILRNVMLSHFSENQFDHKKLLLTLKRIVSLNVIIVIFPVIISILISKYISSFYGSTYSGLEILINTASVWVIFAAIGNVYTQFLLAIGKNWQILLFRIYRDLLSLLSFYILLNTKISVPTAELLIIINFIFQLSFIFLIKIYLFYLYRFK